MNQPIQRSSGGGSLVAAGCVSVLRRRSATSNNRGSGLGAGLSVLNVLNVMTLMGLHLVHREASAHVRSHCSSYLSFDAFQTQFIGHVRQDLTHHSWYQKRLILSKLSYQTQPSLAASNVSPSGFW